MVNKKADISTENRILEVAQKVFVKKGYAAARMEDIAKEAGINRALLHYYFRSKDKMFGIIFQQHFGQLLAGLGDLMTTPMPFDERIKGIIKLYHDKLNAHPELPLFVIHELTQNPGRLVTMVSNLPGGGGVGNLANVFKSIVQNEIKAGNIRPIDGMQLLINILGLIIYPFISRPIFQFVMNVDEKTYQKTLDNRQDEIFDFIMNALKP